MAGHIPPPWQPKQRKINARNSRLRWLMSTGKLKPMSKAEMREQMPKPAPNSNTGKP